MPDQNSGRVWAVMPGQGAGHEGIDGAGARGQHGDERGRAHVKPGPGHDQHAGEAREDGGDARRAETLAEQRAGEAGDDERRGEGDRRDLAERQVVQRGEGADGRHHERQGASALQRRLVRAQHAEALPGADEGGDEEEAREVSHDHGLDRRQGLAGPFGGGVEAAEAGDGGNHEQDAQSGPLGRPLRVSAQNHLRGTLPGRFSLPEA